MLHRHPRQHMLLKVEFRCGHQWVEALILNQSEGGLGLKAPVVPHAGETVELLRGGCWVRARVAWSDEDRFGVEFPNASGWVAETLREVSSQFDICAPVGDAKLAG